MKLNLGCGSDIRPNYVNIDFRSGFGITTIDLSKFPWPFDSNSIDEILMFDFLEHFKYKETDIILNEVWRILKNNAFVDIQVPDFECCALAIMMKSGMICNKCGFKFNDMDLKKLSYCKECGVNLMSIAHSAIMRLYGGQDYNGNFHYTTFTKEILLDKLSCTGFHKFVILEENHQRLNWNFKIRAFKNEDIWREND